MNHLFDIDILNWKTILLYLLPAAINFGIFIYAVFQLSKNGTNLIFATLVFVVGFWQTSEGFTRASESYETALFWSNLCFISLMYVVPLGMLYTMNFLNWQKRLMTAIILFTQLLPALIFTFVIAGKYEKFTVVKSEIWNWVANPEPSILNLVIYCWLSLSALAIIGMHLSVILSSKKSSIRYKQATLLAIGMGIPTLGGIVTEVLFPFAFRLNDIPLTTTLFTAFSCLSFYAMLKYNLLEFSPRQQWELIVEEMSEGLIIVNNSDEIMFANKAFCNQLGYTVDEIKGKVASELFFKNSNQKIEFKKILEDRKKRKSGRYEIKLKDKCGDSVWAMISGSPYMDKNNNVIGSIGIQTNITQRKKAEEKIMKSNRLYSVLSHINQLIVHTDNEMKLFSEACKIATEQGKLEFAWVGLISKEEKKLNLMAENKTLPEDLDFFSNLNYEEISSEHNFILSDKAYVINDIQAEHLYANFKYYALGRNLHSTIFLPIKKSGKTIATFNLYSSEFNFFDKEQIELLEETAGDISFALDFLEKEKERKAAVKKLEYSKSRLNEAQAVSHVGSWELDFTSRIAVLSDEACRIYGVKTTENRQSYDSWVSFIHPDDLEIVMSKMKDFHLSLKETSISYRILRKDGAVRHIFWKTHFDLDADGKPKGIHGIIQDVTEVKQEELNKEFQKNNLTALINNTSDMIWSMDKEMNLISSNKAFDDFVKIRTNKFNGDINRLGRRFEQDRIERWRAWYKRAFSGESFTIVDFCPAPDEKWTEISFYPIFKANEVVGTACYSRNITESKKAEAEIIKFNEQLEDKVIKRTTELASANAMLKKEAQMLNRASKIIAERNRDITDSLNYAKIIQNATVNKTGILDKHFPDSFILTMPQHIVSGDFVRVDEKEGLVLVAVADCTGHGIPGALMSMIGYSFFNDVIDYKRKITPSIVLRSLDTDFKHLTNDDDGINDGMDVGFCSINKANMEVNFAGAHRPLYIIRAQNLIEIKGDNLSIGGHTKEKKRFTNNKLKLQKGDTLYMFSDGYVDQFGGERGKKFTSNRFKETLMSIQQLSMEEQGTFMKKRILDWKGNLEQVDDICLLGIRV